MAAKVLASLTALSLLAAACGTSTDETTTTIIPSTTVAPTTTGSATTEPAALKPQGGTAMVGIASEPLTLNPYLYESVFDFWVGQLYAAYTSEFEAGTQRRIPVVLAEVPTVANGGLVENADGSLTVSLVIREEAIWADGTPISGEDFRFTYEVLIENPPPADPGYDLIDPTTLEVEPKRFSFTLTESTPFVERLFPFVVPAHGVSGTDFLQDWNEEPWVSGGPFVLEEWRKGELLRFVRNEAYWRTDPVTGQTLPYLDEVVFRVFPELDEDSIQAALSEREIDAYQIIDLSAALPRLSELESEGLATTIGFATEARWDHIAFQFGPGRAQANPGSLNDHLEFRRAMAHAIDVGRLAKEVYGATALPIRSYIEASSPTLSSRPWVQYDHDPERARQLIAQLCERLGRDCDAEPPQAVIQTIGEQRRAAARLVAEMLGGIGVNAVVAEAQLDLFNEEGTTFEDGEWDLALFSWINEPGLAPILAGHDTWDPDGAPPEGFNFQRWGVTGGPSAQRYRDIFAAMRSTVDESVLAELVAEAEQILADEVVVIPLVSRARGWSVWADEIAGSLPDSGSGITWNIEEWYRADG